jgi:hypothetical protein
MRTPVTGTITATGIVSLPNPMSDRVCSYLIQFESVAFNGSLTIKGAVIDQAYTGIALAYKNMNTGLNATAAITGNTLVLVDSAGINLILDVTSVVSGSLKYTAIPLIG